MIKNLKADKDALTRGATGGAMTDAATSSRSKPRLRVGGSRIGSATGVSSTTLKPSMVVQKDTKAAIEIELISGGLTIKITDAQAALLEKFKDLFKKTRKRSIPQRGGGSMMGSATGVSSITNTDITDLETVTPK